MKKILGMAVISTTGMTLFSYLLAVVFKERFLETAQLNRLTFPNKSEKRKHHPFGYLIHYLVGIFFSSCYYLAWQRLNLKADTVTSAVMGFLNGLIGIAVWNIAFSLHPKSPKVNRMHFYSQLLAAHVLFGTLNNWTYNKYKN
ncbi:MAG TPA: hypothetical protein VFD91_06790 [Mariniphaga sp.]|nr:hypothetical protein [Mariniphaga sp.]